MVLDEPTNGLDPQGTREVRSLIASLAGDGTTVLVSSHLLSEVEQVCTHIGVMHVGRLVAQGTAAELRGDRESEARIETDQPGEAARIMRELGLLDVHVVRSRAIGRLAGVAPEKVVAACVHRGLSVRRVRGRLAHPGGHLRLAHGRGFRCQRLSSPPVPRSGRCGCRRGSSRSELRLVFRRRRNLAGLVVLAAVPVFISIAVKSQSSRPGREAPDFFRSITENGLFVALAALTIEMGLFLPLAVAVIAGDAVAGEANVGTLRYLLGVPVSRLRLLAVKYAAIVVFSFVATFTITVTGIVMGLLLFGGGDMTLLSGTQVGFADGAGRVALATAYLACGIASLGAVGLFISTLTEQPIGATIAVVVFSTASFILDSIPQVDWLHPYLITHHWPAFGDLFRDPIVWNGVGQGLYVAAAYVVVFFLAAWARFAGKDVTS